MTIAEIQNLLEDWHEETGGEWELTLSGMCECAWTATLRILLKPNAPGCDESIVFLKCGSDDLEYLVNTVYSAAKRKGLFRRRK